MSTCTFAPSGAFCGSISPAKRAATYNWVISEARPQCESLCAGEGACNVAVDIPPLPPPRVSKSDDDFLRDGIEFMWGIGGIDVEELNTLFSKARLLINLTWQQLT